MMAGARFAARLAVLLFLALLPGLSLAADCQGCHALGGLFREEKPLYVTTQMHRQTVHTLLTCDDCHKGVQSFPHDQAQETRCDLPCHAAGKSHAALAGKVASGPHPGKGGKACLACHNALGLNSAKEGGRLCEGCHAGIRADRPDLEGSAGGFGARAHFKVADPARKPKCVSCHRDHDFTAQAARSACSQKGCHEGADEKFGLLFDHGGEGNGFPLETAGKALLLFVAAILLLHLVKG